MLLVGLGNPGSEYEATRHNAGFMAVDALHRHYAFPDFKQKFRGLISQGEIGRHKVTLFKPMTFMNNSGEAVQELTRFYKTSPEEIVVLYDELDLPVGRIRTKTGGGAGGHNGLKSLDKHIGNGYHRVRIGIDHPGDKNKVSSYVLKPFGKAERETVDKVIDAITSSISLILTGEQEKFMSKVALILNPPAPKPKKEPTSNDEDKNGI